MPPEMAVSMRHSKLKREEAALLAGEINKPSWESKNEGIHERVSFEDSIWGFDLAGGSFYKTPLRVTYVKPDSRAAKAGIRPGDKLKRINDIDTSTLTIQEAHEIIIESGIHLKLAVTAPEDEEDAYYCYEDPLNDPYDSDEERRREEEKVKKRQVHARVSHYWSLQWPWVSKRRIIYRESNCFMVDSKFEDKHRDKFPPRAFHRYSEDRVLDSLKNLELKPKDEGKTEFEILQEKLNGIKNQNDTTNGQIKDTPVVSNDNKSDSKVQPNANEVNESLTDENNANVAINGLEELSKVIEAKEENSLPANESPEVKTPDAELSAEQPALSDDIADEANKDEINGTVESIESNEEIVSDSPLSEESVQVISENGDENLEETLSSTVNTEKNEQKDDDFIEELLKGHDGNVSKDVNDILDSIVNENGIPNEDMVEDR